MNYEVLYKDGTSEIITANTIEEVYNQIIKQVIMIIKISD